MTEHRAPAHRAEMSVVAPNFVPGTTEQIRSTKQNEVIQMSTSAAVASDTVTHQRSSSTLSEGELRTMLLEQHGRRRVSGFDRIVMRVSLMALLWARHHTAPADLPHEEQLRLVLNDRARESRLNEHSLRALHLR